LVSQAARDEWEIAVAYVTRCLLIGTVPDARYTAISRYTSPAFLGEGDFQGIKPMSPSVVADDYIAEAYREMEARESIVSAWRGRFDEQGVPLSAGDALEFNRHVSRCFSRFSTFDLPIFCVYRMYESGTSTDIEISYPIELRYYSTNLTVGGQGKLRIDGKETVLKPGSVLLVPPTCSCVVERDASSSNWEVFSARFLLNPETWYLADWVESFSRPYVIELEPGETLERFVSDYSELSTLFASKDLMEQHLAQNLLENILLRLRMLSSRDDVTGDPRVVEAANYFLYHLNESLTVEDVAEHLGVSSKQLRRLFVKQFGQSPTAWLSSTRMKMAADLLQNSNLSIAEVAYRVGYDDPLYFSRVFRRAMKQPPRDYRAAHRNSPG